jgi:hypothetical protein
MSYDPPLESTAIAILFIRLSHQKRRTMMIKSFLLAQVLSITMSSHVICQGVICKCQ